MFLLRWNTLFRILGGVGRSGYRGWRYLLYIALLTPSILFLRIVVIFFQVLDYVLFPGFVNVEIKDPVGIVSAPRSGSTFLHRLVVMDEQFASIKLWHTLFPSITIYKLVALYQWFENLLPVQPSKLILNAINNASFGGWDDIHKTGLNFYEEDEHYWVQIFASPIGLMLFYPYIWRYAEIIELDELPAHSRTLLSLYLKRSIQRFMYVNPGKTYLFKNAASGGRAGLYLDAMPGLKAIHISRDINQTIPSALSMFTKPWQTHSPHCIGDTPETAAMVKILVRNYLAYERFMEDKRLVSSYSLRYQDLVSDPYDSVADIYRNMGLEISEEYEKALEQETNKARGYKSSHQYNLEQYGLTEERLQEQLAEEQELG